MEDTFRHEEALREELAFQAGKRVAEKAGLVGKVRIEHRNREGVVVGVRDFKNTITDIGRASVAAQIVALITTPFRAVALGLGTTPSAIADTALQIEINTSSGPTRQWGSASQVLTDVASDTSQVVATFSFNSPFAVTECGLFDSTPQAAGKMMARQVFAVLNVTGGDSLQITWKIDVD